jgi:pilus assembly protein CpaB
VNPRQRRGAVFLALAALGAIAVFFSVIGFVNNVESEVGDRGTAWVVDREVPAYQPVTPADLREIEMPRRWMPDSAVVSLDVLAGQVAATALQPGTLLQSSNFVPAPSLQPGQREIAILVDAETGVAGKIRPGDRVDVWATFDDLGDLDSPRTKLIAQRLLVINVGLGTTRETESDTGAVESRDAVPVTFALDEQNIKSLTFAESFAKQVRLALRPPADETEVPADRRSYVETFGTDAGTAATGSNQ